MYEIADQSQVWVDIDACESLLKAAEDQGHTSTQAFPLLEQALRYLERGEFLEGECGTWVYSLQKKSEDLLRQCRLWLAESYEVHGKLLQACLQYRALLQTVPLDEDVLRAWLEMLHRHGKAQEALKCYQDMKGFVEAQGFTLSNTIEQVVASLDKQPAMVLLSSVQLPEDILPLKRDLGEQSMGHSRRDFVQSLFGITGTTLFPGILSFDMETLERLSRALRSTDLDETTLMHLEKATQAHRYEYVHSGGSMWQEIFQEMSGHLRMITQLLERHNQDSHLCTIAGETSLLLGDILFNAGDNVVADKYYQGAIEACKDNNLLRAVILGRRALLSIYAHYPQRAIQFIDEAQQVAPSTTADLIVAWLWAVKAEAYAKLGDTAACFQALFSAERLVERGRSGSVSLAFQPEIEFFNLTKFSGYKGACLLHLKHSEAAQDILHDQIILEQARVHHKSIALVDLATTFAQQASIRHAYEYATDALNCLEQTKSIRVFQRLLKLRQALNPWVSTTYVKNLDEHINSFARDLKKGVQ